MTNLKLIEAVVNVGMGEFSLELCGGTHVARTGDIGVFKIVAEAGVAAGVRRIEALTGTGANEYLDSQLARLDSIAGKLRGNREDVETKVDQLLERIKRLEKEKQQLQQPASTPEVTALR